MANCRAIDSIRISPPATRDVSARCTSRASPVRAGSRARISLACPSSLCRRMGSRRRRGSCHASPGTLTPLHEAFDSTRQPTIRSKPTGSSTACRKVIPDAAKRPSVSFRKWMISSGCTIVPSPGGVVEVRHGTSLEEAKRRSEGTLRIFDVSRRRVQCDCE
jgi:hypothetical protein